MKVSKLILCLAIITVGLFVINGCKKVKGCTDVAASNFNSSAQVNDGSCKYPVDTADNQITFYFDQSGAEAVVTIDTHTRVTSVPYPVSPPACGIYAAGCANFALAVGTYTYSAVSSTSSWSGTVTILPKQCQEVLLKQATGSVVFWTDSAGYGLIDVRMNGGSGNISNTITTGTPVCGASGCVTFDLPPGTYNYIAYSAIGNGNWSGAVSISADGCQQVRFH